MEKSSAFFEIFSIFLVDFIPIPSNTGSKGKTGAKNLRPVSRAEAYRFGVARGCAGMHGKAETDYLSFSWNIWIASFGLALPRLSFMSWPTRY